MTLRALISLFATLWATHGIAAAMDAEAVSVWTVIVTSWADEVAENRKWPAEYVHDSVVAWGADWPFPQGKQSLIDWERFDNEATTILKHELFPLKIVVVGDTAAAHYSAVTVTETSEGEREREVIGLVETLVREGDGWRFLSLTSFALGGEDDD